MKKIVGIDISKDSFHAAYVDISGELIYQEWPYKKETDLDKFFDKLHPESCLVMEATGVYHKSLAYAAAQRGYKVCVENPARIKLYAKLKNITTKTDKADAKLIAKYALNNDKNLDWFKLPSIAADELDQLRMYEAGLKKVLQSQKNRLESVKFHPRQSLEVTEMLEEDIEQLNKRIEEVQKKMQKISKKEFGNYYKILKSIPGIGDKTAVDLICVLNSFSGWDEENLTKRFVKYVGLAPVVHQSGKSVRKKTFICRSSTPFLRAKLYMGAMSAIYKTKNDNIFKRYHKKKLGEKKPEKQIILAVMQKMVKIAIALIRDNMLFDEIKYGVAKKKY